MIEIMKPKNSFHQAEIQDGDIICFQKTLEDAEHQQLVQQNLPVDAPQFYEYLLNLTTIRFIPKPNAPQNGVATTPLPEFDLALSKKNSYDEVARAVADHVVCNPAFLRFTTINATSGTPRAAVKLTPNTTLGSMLTSQYYTNNNVSSTALYYEVLEIPLAELETKKSIKLTWIHDGISKEEPLEALVPKIGEISDAIPTLQKKFKIPDEDIPRIRFFQGYQGRLTKELPQNYNIAGLQDYMTTYAELIPKEELEAGPTETKLVDCFHFQKEPSKVHVHGVPFKFVMRKGEVFEETRKRLQARTGIKGKLFEKVKFAVVKKASFSKPIYLSDGN